MSDDLSPEEKLLQEMQGRFEQNKGKVDEAEVDEETEKAAETGREVSELIEDTPATSNQPSHSKSFHMDEQLKKDLEEAHSIKESIAESQRVQDTLEKDERDNAKVDLSVEDSLEDK